MTNTRNTPIEALENSTPMVVRRLSVARGTGGDGAHRGGDGIEKEIEFTKGCVVHLLADRRLTAPYGLSGGSVGASGEDEVVRADGSSVRAADGRFGIEVGAGDRLKIRTPGGGGWGKPVSLRG
jgi:N-methylhydantoinase B/oxoprolinase/acetone carboxylase alpha subunit